MLEKTLESPLDCKEIQPVHPKGNKSWIFFWRTDAEAPILWPPSVKSWLIWKDPDAGQDGRQEEKGTTENEMVGWHHWLYGHEFEQAPGVDGLGSLVCCSPWGHKELDTTEWLNWTEATYSSSIQDLLGKFSIWTHFLETAPFSENGSVLRAKRESEPRRDGQRQNLSIGRQKEFSQSTCSPA